MKRIFGFFFAFVPFLIVVLIQLGAQSYMYLLASIFHSDQFYRYTSQNDFLTVMMIVYSLLTIWIFSFWYYTRLGGEFGRKAVVVLRPKLILSLVFLTPGLQVVTGIFCNLIFLFKPDLMDVYQSLLDNSGVLDASVIMLIYSIVLAPIGEELCFRAVTLRMFRRVIRSFWIANFFQALLFGIFHMNLVQGLYAFVLGLFLGLVCERTGSIYASILLHILYNAWGVLISGLIDGLDSPVLTGVILLVMIACLTIGLLLFASAVSKKKR